MPVRPVPPPPGPEGRPLSYSPTPVGSNDSQLSCMTISSDSVTGREGASSSLWEQRKEEIAAAGLSGFGDSPTAVWVGNIPESSSSEEAIREGRLAVSDARLLISHVSSSLQQSTYLQA